MEAHNPDEQLANLKNWWKQYGNALMAGITIGVLLLAGGTYWKQYKTKRAEIASQMYEDLLAEFQQVKTEAVTSLAKKLEQDYSATPYAGKAALILARQLLDAKDIAAARQQLDWAMQNAIETVVRHSARLRLARLLLAQGDADAALALAGFKDTDGFASEYAELRGDVLLSQGKRNEARLAYEEAIRSLSSNSSYLQVLTMKRDDLGPGQAP